MNEQLTTIEKSRLAECESVIKKSMNSFYEMGVALKEIKDKKLYKEFYETFEDYCQSVWELKRTYSHYLINSVATLDNISDVHYSEQVKETQVRPLIKLKDDPELQRQAWEEVVKQSEETHEPITAKKVEEVVSKYCNPCVNPAIEFRRVFYLTPYYDNKLTDLMRGEKESTYLRGVIEKHVDENS